MTCPIFLTFSPFVPTPKKRATIRDVASAANVSISTASMALRGLSHVSKDTRARILKVARKLNYRCDLLYSIIASRRSLRQRKETLTIGALLDFRIPSAIATRDALKAAVQAIGGTFIFFDVPANDPIDRPLEILRARGCSGIILRIPCNAQRSNFTSFDGLAVVCIDELDQQYSWPFDLIRRAHGYDVRTAWRRLYSAGYRRIGAAIYKHSPTVSDDLDRLGAVLALQNEFHPRKERIEPLWTTDHDMLTQQNWILREKPDAILAFSSSTLWCTHDLGISVPQDLGVVVLHVLSDTIKVRNTIYRPTGFFWNDNIVAKATINILLDKLRREELGPSSHPLLHLLPATWRNGNTTRPL